jgi:hypothetical protein
MTITESLRSSGIAHITLTPTNGDVISFRIFYSADEGVDTRELSGLYTDGWIDTSTLLDALSLLQEIAHRMYRRGLENMEREHCTYLKGPDTTPIRVE